MNNEFWISRWRENKTGFHQEQINADLQRFAERLELQPGDHLFVPLCGKSLDMLWLAEQGYRVTGVELSELAAEAFFTENGIEMKQEAHGDFVRYAGGGVEILCGDFFKLRSGDLAGVRAVYDRAALIALPPAMRLRYARRMGELLPQGARILLIAIEYDQEKMDGPPFSVAEREIGEIFGDAFTVALLEENESIEENPRFRTRGLESLIEKSYLLERLAE